MTTRAIPVKLMHLVSSTDHAFDELSHR